MLARTPQCSSHCPWPCLAQLRSCPPRCYCSADTLSLGSAWADRCSHVFAESIPGDTSCEINLSSFSLQYSRHHEPSPGRLRRHSAGKFTLCESCKMTIERCQDSIRGCHKAWLSFCCRQLAEVSPAAEATGQQKPVPEPRVSPLARPPEPQPAASPFAAASAVKVEESQARQPFHCHADLFCGS
jgi:hypothetical protein